jgi:hypothetical protein
MESVFDRIDHQHRSFFFAVLWNVEGWRRYFAFCVLASLAAWTVLGFDSTWSMALPFAEKWVHLLTGQVSFWDVWAESRLHYGVGNHWSAPVIYGTLWVVTSLYLESQRIVRSMNFCVTTALSLMSIGLFEIAWNSLYAVYQGQWWTITYAYKQSANLSTFLTFIAVGFLAVIYMLTEGYRPRVDRRLMILVIITLSSWVLWVNYPLQTGTLQVTRDDGTTWQSSPKFPQTYYAVDMLPGDALAIGTPYYMPDNLVHFTNTWTKVITTAAIGYLLAFKKKLIPPEYDKSVS